MTANSDQAFAMCQERWGNIVIILTLLMRKLATEVQELAQSNISRK